MPKEAEFAQNLTRSGTSTLSKIRAKGVVKPITSQRVKIELSASESLAKKIQSSEGKQCGERSFLELDHIEPWSLGGKSSEKNLRLLCKTHNQWRGERTFGTTYTCY